MKHVTALVVAVLSCALLSVAVAHNAGDRTAVAATVSPAKVVLAAGDIQASGRTTNPTEVGKSFTDSGTGTCR
jgi:hypothetical protein